MYTLTEPLALRAASPDDQGFLDALYFASRSELHAISPDARLVAQLVSMQQQVQAAGFRQQFPNAQHLILTRSGEPIGRVVVDAGPTDLRLVDIAVLPQARRSGAAKAALRALQAAARAQQLGMSLAVSRANPVARQLYLDQGFTVVREDALFEQMVWSHA